MHSYWSACLTGTGTSGVRRVQAISCWSVPVRKIEVILIIKSFRPAAEASEELRPDSSTSVCVRGDLRWQQTCSSSPETEHLTLNTWRWTLLHTCRRQTEVIDHLFTVQIWMKTLCIFIHQELNCHLILFCKRGFSAAVVCSGSEVRIGFLLCVTSQRLLLL